MLNAFKVSIDVPALQVNTNQVALPNDAGDSQRLSYISSGIVLILASTADALAGSSMLPRLSASAGTMMSPPAENSTSTSQTTDLGRLDIVSTTSNIMNGGVKISSEPRFSPPSLSRQGTFFATGVLAGAASLPVEAVYISASQQFDHKAGIKHLRSHVAPVLARTGIRFLSFDHVRTYSSHFLQLPTTLCGALGGAAGGLNEVILHSVVSNRRLPPLQAALSQSGKLFLCFGTYTYLSTTFSRELPPKPFWKCWMMGATAGCVGSAITAAVEGAKGRALMSAAVRGTFVIGTVISVQVTTCAAGLRMLQT